MSSSEDYQAKAAEALVQLGEAKSEAAVEDFKKPFPRVWRRSPTKRPAASP